MKVRNQPSVNLTSLAGQEVGNSKGQESLNSNPPAARLLSPVNKARYASACGASVTYHHFISFTIYLNMNYKIRINANEYEFT